MDHWIGGASRDHVKLGVAGGFCQLGHGKHEPVKRLRPGDRLVYYSPRERLAGGEPVQAFTSIGEILDRDVYPGEMGGGFRPFRRDVRFFEAEDAPIRPLLGRLSFTSGQASWGAPFRRGLFKIDGEDYRLIADAMKVDQADR